MADNEVNNLASSMNALTKQMEKMSAQQILQNKNINEQKKDFEDILKNSKELEKSYDKQGNYLKEVAVNLKDSLASTIKLGSTITKIGTTAFAANIVKDLVELDNRMTAVSVRMGKGHKGIKELKNSVNGLQKEFGTSYENAVNFVEELAKDKYVGNIKEAAAGIDLFSRASGVAASEVLELTNNLSKMGGLSTSAINSIYAEMIKVQQTVGISDKGMNSLLRTVNDVAFSMAAMGKTSDDIKRMTTNTTALVGAMEKVGVSAQRSTELITQLTDPDRIEDNIMLYSQLGISMQDALSDGLDPSAFGGQFKEMADRITSLGPIAGSAFAKSMGLSYKEVTRMAKMEAGEVKDIAEQASTPEEQALETMKALEKSTEGIGKQFETSFNKLEGTLKSMPMALLIGLGIAAPLIIRQGKKIFHKIFDRREVQASVADAVVPAVKNSFVKAGGIIKGEAVKVGNVVKGNVGQWFDSTYAGELFNGVDKRVDSLMAKVNKESFADKFLSASKKNALDDAEARLVDINAKKEKIFAGIDKLGGKTTTFDEKTGKLNINEQDFGKDKKALKAARALAKVYNEINNEQMALEKRKEKMSKSEKIIQAAAEATAALEEKKAAASEAIRANLVGRKEDEKKILDINVEIAKLEKDKKGMGVEGEAAMNAKIKSLKTEKDQIEKIAKKRQEAAESARKEKEAAEATAKATKEAAGAISQKQINGLSKLFAGLGTKIGTAFSHTTLGKNMAERSGQGFAGGAKAVGKTVAGFAGKTGLKALKGIGKGIGSIMKSVGPMALVMAIVGKLLSKIREPLERAINTIVDSMSPIIEAMLPAIEILMNTVAQKIMPLALTILSGILKVAHLLLKPIVGIFHLLGNLPGKIGEAAKGIGDAIDAATGPQVSEGLLTAADKLSETSISMKTSSENLNEAAAAEESDDGPTTIEARGAYMVAAGTTSSYNQTESSSSNTDEKLKEEKDEKEKARNNKNIEGIGENTSVLPKILNALEEIIEIIVGKEVNIFDEEPQVSILE